MINTAETRLKAIDAIVYGDAFNCAVSIEEVYEYSRIKMDAGQLGEFLQKLLSENLIEQNQGFFHLPGRESLAEERAESIELSVRLHDRAKRVAHWLRHLPFIRDIYLTGSVAADNAEPGADVDLMIVVSAGRPGIVFSLLGPLSRVLTRQVFCPNYYISEENLHLGRRSHYVAREVAQARPLMGEGNPLLDANQWFHEELPNFQSFKSGAGIPRGSPLQKALEFLLRGRLGEYLESRARQLALKRLEAHYGVHGQSIPDKIRGQFERGEAFRFHANQKVQAAEEKHRKRCELLLAAMTRFAESETGNQMR